MFVKNDLTRVQRCLLRSVTTGFWGIINVLLAALMRFMGGSGDIIDMNAGNEWHVF